MLRNLWKSNRALSDTGWELVPIEQMNQWDGLTSWYDSYVRERRDILELPYLKDWHRALLASTRLGG
jgi:hypothetical protein